MRRCRTVQLVKRGQQWALSLCPCLCVMAIVVVTGCGGPAQGNPVASATQKDPLTSAPSASQAATEATVASIPSKAKPAELAASSPAAAGDARPLKAGMAYADFRVAALAQGWRPVKDPACMENVVGNYEFMCKGEHPSASCQACASMPELSICSFDSHCVMRFSKDNGRELFVTTYGEIGDWNASGPQSDLKVMEFREIDAGKQK